MIIFSAYNKKDFKNLDEVANKFKLTDEKVIRMLESDDPNNLNDDELSSEYYGMTRENAIKLYSQMQNNKWHRVKEKGYLAFHYRDYCNLDCALLAPLMDRSVVENLMYDRHEGYFRMQFNPGRLTALEEKVSQEFLTDKHFENNFLSAKNIKVIDNIIRKSPIFSNPIKVNYAEGIPTNSPEENQKMSILKKEAIAKIDSLKFQNFFDFVHESAKNGYFWTISY